MGNLLTHDVGYRLFGKESNEENLVAFEKILPNFFLNDETNARVIANFKKETRSTKEQYVDDLFKMDENRHTFIEVPKTQDTDEGFKKYYEMINRVSCKSGKWRAVIEEFSLQTYKVYKKGKVTVKKQECKLFKFLLQKKIFTKEEIEQITTIRQSSKKLYIIISRNPIDFLFCATNQNFGSCLSLSSDHGEAFYMGLAGATVDPNRVIMMLSNGKYKRFTVKGEEFKHFKIISRSWGVVGTAPDVDKDILHITKYYPNSQAVIKFCKPISDIFGIEINDKREPFYGLHGKYPFEFPKFKNDFGVSFMYLDNFGVVKYKSGRYGYDFANGGTGCKMKSWRWSRGFERMKTINNLDGSISCVDCGNGMREDDAYYNENDDGNGDAFCWDCFNAKYFHCKNCDKFETKENGHEYDNSTYCLDCFDKLFTTCTHCDDPLRIDDGKDGDGSLYCTKCFDEIYTACVWCKDVHRRDSGEFTEVDSDLYCKTCHFAVYGDGGNEKFIEFDMLEAC